MTRQPAILYRLIGGILTSKVKTDTVTPTRPTANFSVTQGPAYDQIAVNGSTSIAFGGATITQYVWTFGNGTGTTTTTPTVSNVFYGSPGTYTVTLVVTDSGGLSSMPVSRTVTVTAPIGGPTAVLPAPSVNGLNITYSTTGSKSADGTALTYDVNFGDGSAHATTASGGHTYATGDVYTVTLTVTDIRGAKATAIRSVSVATTALPLRNAFDQPFQSTSPWNTAIGSNAVFGSNTSATYNDQIKGAGLVNHPTYTISIIQAQLTDPIVTLTSKGDTGTSYQKVSPLYIPDAPPIEAIQQGSTGDTWTSIVQPDGHTNQEISGTVAQTSTFAATGASNWTSKHARISDVKGDGITTGTRASNTSNIGGVIRLYDMAQGAIRHAVALSYGGNQLGYQGGGAVPGATKSQQFVWPASNVDQDWLTSYTGNIRIGTLFAIPPGVDVTKINDANGVPITGVNLMLARAFQDYGGYVAARGPDSSARLYGEYLLTSAQCKALTVAFNLLRPQLREVMNNSPTSVGGGGTPRQPPLPGFADDQTGGGGTGGGGTGGGGTGGGGTGGGGTTPTPSTATIVSRVVGVPTTTAATVTVRTSGAVKARLQVGTDSAVSQNLVYGPQVVPSAQGDSRLTVTGLSTSTRDFYYRVMTTDSAGNESPDTLAKVGHFRTAPTGATNFAFDFGSCTNAADSASMAAMDARNDDLFFHLGDLYYADGSGTTVANIRSKFAAKIQAPNHAGLFSSTACVYTPSDHDGMNNNSVYGDDPTAWTNWNQVYREQWPYASSIPSGTGCYFTFVWGRVRFIVLDDRSFKSATALADGTSKTALGSTQKAWLKSTVTAATEAAIVIVQGAPWQGNSAGDDGWAGYATERNELAAFFAASGKLIAMLGGDQHALSASKPTQTAYSGGPQDGVWLFQAAPFNNSASIKYPPYTIGPYPTTGGATVQQYGRVVVTDDGTTIRLTFTGYSSDNTQRVTLSTP